MFIWKICLLIILCLLPIDLLLRSIADSTVPEQKGLKWGRYSKEKLLIIRKRNGFLYTLLIVTGVISNLSLLVLIISIPLFFIFGI